LFSNEIRNCIVPSVKTTFGEDTENIAADIFINLQ